MSHHLTKPSIHICNIETSRQALLVFYVYERRKNIQRKVINNIYICNLKDSYERDLFTLSLRVGISCRIKLVCFARNPRRVNHVGAKRLSQPRELGTDFSSLSLPNSCCVTYPLTVIWTVTWTVESKTKTLVWVKTFCFVWLETKTET